MIKRLKSKPVEFDQFKIRVVQLLPEAQEINCGELAIIR